MNSFRQSFVAVARIIVTQLAVNVVAALLLSITLSTTDVGFGAVFLVFPYYLLLVATLTYLVMRALKGWSRKPLRVASLLGAFLPLLVIIEPQILDASEVTTALIVAVEIGLLVNVGATLLLYVFSKSYRLSRELGLTAAILVVIYGGLFVAQLGANNAARSVNQKSLGFSVYTLEEGSGYQLKEPGEANDINSSKAHTSFKYRITNSPDSYTPDLEVESAKAGHRNLSICSPGEAGGVGARVCYTVIGNVRGGQIYFSQNLNTVFIELSDAYITLQFAERPNAAEVLNIADKLRPATENELAAMEYYDY